MVRKIFGKVRNMENSKALILFLLIFYTCACFDLRIKQNKKSEAREKPKHTETIHTHMCAICTHIHNTYYTQTHLLHALTSHTNTHTPDIHTIPHHTTYTIYTAYYTTQCRHTCTHTPHTIYTHNTTHTTHMHTPHTIHTHAHMCTHTEHLFYRPLSCPILNINNTYFPRSRA